MLLSKVFAVATMHITVLTAIKTMFAAIVNKFLAVIILWIKHASVPLKTLLFNHLRGDILSRSHELSIVAVNISL